MHDFAFLAAPTSETGPKRWQDLVSYLAFSAVARDDAALLREMLSRQTPSGAEDSWWQLLTASLKRLEGDRLGAIRILDGLAAAGEPGIALVALALRAAFHDPLHAPEVLAWSTAALERSSAAAWWTRGLAHSTLGGHWRLHGDMIRATHHYSRALADFLRADDVAGQAKVLCNLASLLMTRGMHRAAHSLLVRTRALCARAGQLMHTSFYYMYGFNLHEMGRHDEALATLDAGIRLADQLLVAKNLEWLHYRRSLILASQGDWQGAQADLDRVLAYIRRGGTAILATACFRLQAEAARQQGRSASDGPWWEPLQSQRPSPIADEEIEMALLEVRLLLDAGEVDAASTRLTELRPQATAVNSYRTLARLDAHWAWARQLAGDSAGAAGAFARAQAAAIRHGFDVTAITWELPASLSRPSAAETDSGKPDLILTCFGQLELHSADGVLLVSGQTNHRTGRLLARLVLSEGACSREDLLRAVYGSADAEPNPLFMVIDRLRKRVSALTGRPEPLIEWAEGHYRLNPQWHCRIDWHRFQRHWRAWQVATVASERRRHVLAAMALYKGPLLAPLSDLRWVRAAALQTCEQAEAMLAWLVGQPDDGVTNTLQTILDFLAAEPLSVAGNQFALDGYLVRDDWHGARAHYRSLQRQAEKIGKTLHPILAGYADLLD